jgi:hypothetical protein
MGTRSLTIMKEAFNKTAPVTEIAVLYRQYDGHLDSHGQELAEFLSQFAIVNGISLAEKRKIANGGSCLAAQIVAHFKTEAGGFYLHPAGTRDADEEYRYTVLAIPDNPIWLTAEEGYGSEWETLFEGTPQTYLLWVKNFLAKREEEA